MKYRNLSHSLYVIKGLIVKKVGTINRLNALWWGIKLGRHVSFYGRCQFFRFPGTTIEIGNNCHFSSNLNMNRIGLSRPCSLSTLKSEYDNVKILIGDYSGFSGTVIGAFKSITIGDNVKCGANTLITDADWHLDDPRSGTPADVVINNNVWLGEGVNVLKGVTIGENTLIGAGSIVTKSIPANVIAAGNPCKVIKKINITFG